MVTVHDTQLCHLVNGDYLKVSNFSKCHSAIKRNNVDHPSVPDQPDTPKQTVFYSLRKPRWGEHFTPPLCKSFRKLGRLARWVGWLAGRQIHFEPSREKRRKSLKRTRKATSSSSSSGMSLVFLVENSINQTKVSLYWVALFCLTTCLTVKVITRWHSDRSISSLLSSFFLNCHFANNQA